MRETLTDDFEVLNVLRHIMAPVQMWRFQDAPEELRNLSTNGGDEDWICVVHRVYTYHATEGGGRELTYYMPWLEVGQHTIGCCDVDEFVLSDGSLVFIGSHS